MENIYQITIYKELPLEQKKLVDLGSLANWDIILLTKVLQAPYTKLNKSKLDIENKELLKIRLNYIKCKYKKIIYNK